MNVFRLLSRPRLKVATAFVVGALACSLPGASAAPGDPASGIVPINPTRILDTRAGLGAPKAPVSAGQSIDLAVAGVAGVPANATGVVANVTVTGGSTPSFVTVWPTGQTRPTASSLNVTPGLDLPNEITVALGAGGKVSLFNNAGSVDIVADVTGYLVPGGAGGGATSFVRTKIDTPTVAASATKVQSLSLPAGSWLLLARVDGAHNGTADSSRLECDLLDAGGVSLEHAKMRAQASNAVQPMLFVSLTLQGITTLTTPGVVQLSCGSTNATSFTLTTADMSAVQVAAPTVQP